MLITPQKRFAIPEIAVIIACYLSLCFAGFFSNVGQNALLMAQNGEIIADNIFVAGFAGGLLTIFIYEFLTRMAFSSMSRRVVDARAYRYQMRFFFFGANILIGLIRLLYLAFPLFFVFGEIFVAFFVYFIALIIFFIYCRKTTLKPHEYAPFLSALVPVFFGFYLLTTLFMLASEVLL